MLYFPSFSLPFIKITGFWEGSESALRNAEFFKLVTISEYAHYAKPLKVGPGSKVLIFHPPSCLCIQFHEKCTSIGKKRSGSSSSIQRLFSFLLINRSLHHVPCNEKEKSEKTHQKVIASLHFWKLYSSVPIIRPGRLLILEANPHRVAIIWTGR